MARLSNFVQMGSDHPVDIEAVDAKIKLFLAMAKALDGESPTMETAIAFASLKLICEKELGHQVEVAIRFDSPEKTREDIIKEVKEEYERTGKVAPLDPRSTDPTFH